MTNPRPQNPLAKKKNCVKMRLRDPSKTLPRFRDQAKLFRDPHFQGTILYPY